MLEQIKKRHEVIENRPLKAMCQIDGELAHKDRDELLKIVEELQKEIDHLYEDMAGEDI
jgi:hypothetical protein